MKGDELGMWDEEDMNRHEWLVQLREECGKTEFPGVSQLRDWLVARRVDGRIDCALWHAINEIERLQTG